MQILSARIDNVRHQAIQLAPSPEGHDEELWTIPYGHLRDTCCLTHSVLATERVELTVRLFANPTPSTRISIEGMVAGGSSVFREDVRSGVEPGAWRNGIAECRILLDATSLRGRGVTWGGVVWNWSWEDDQPRGSLGRSEHLVFVIAEMPSFPWTAAQRPGPNEARPWPGVLALACQWASGAAGTNAVPSRILDGIVSLQENPGVPWTYDSGARSYLNATFGPHVFYCDRFIAAARGLDPDLPHKLSCYEGAAVMTTFANVLGCSLRPVLTRMNDCGDICVNTIWSLGNRPETGRKFHVHVVACVPSRESMAKFRVFDPLIRFDTDERPAERPNRFEFPSGIPFGDVDDRAGTGVYLPQVIRADDIESSSADELGVAQIPLPDQSRFKPCDFERWLRYSHVLKERTRISAPGAPTMFEIPGFVRAPATPLPEPPPRPDKSPFPAVPPRTRTVYEPADPSAPDKSGAKLIADFWTSSTDSSLSFMAELMALADQPPVPVNGPSIAYLSPEGGTLWVLLQGATARLVSVGRRPIDLVQILNVATPL